MSKKTKRYVGLLEVTHMNAGSTYLPYFFEVPSGENPQDHFFNKLANNLKDPTFWELYDWCQTEDEWLEVGDQGTFVELYEISDGLDVSNFTQRIIEHLKQKKEQTDEENKKTIRAKLKTFYGLDLDEEGLADLCAHMANPDRIDKDVCLGHTTAGYGATWETEFRGHVLILEWNFDTGRILDVPRRVVKQR